MTNIQEATSMVLTDEERAALAALARASKWRARYAEKRLAGLDEPEVPIPNTRPRWTSASCPFCREQ